MGWIRVSVVENNCYSLPYMIDSVLRVWRNLHLKRLRMIQFALFVRRRATNQNLTTANGINGHIGSGGRTWVEH